MKKLVASLCTLAFLGTLSAQDLISKIPATASAVVSIKGKRITDLVSVQEFSDSKLGQMLNKQLSKASKEKVTDLAGLGLDLNSNFYYFLEADKGVFTNCFLIPLQNAQGFQHMLGESEKERIVKENGLSYFQDDYDGTVTMWSGNTLLVVVSKDQQNSYSYYDDLYLEDTVAVPAEDTELEELEEVVEEVEMTEEAPVFEEAEVMEAPEELVEEEVVIESVAPEVAEDNSSYNDYYNSEAYKRQEAEREKRRKEREAKREARRKEMIDLTLAKAKSILKAGYAQGSILTNPGYLKSMGGGKEEASAWIADFGKIYKETLPGSLYSGMMGTYGFMDIDKMYGGISITAKLDFAEDHVAMNTVYSMNNELAEIYKPMYDGKFNPNFAKYLNEDRLLAYMSLNMSTEGLLKAYPKLIQSIFKDNGEKSYGDAVSLGTQVFSLLIDEEAAAELIRGDMLLVLTDLREREVTYTDYEYDAEYNYKKVEKTKTEAIPDFMFMFSSEQKSIFDRIMRIGVNENELIGTNGIYQVKNIGSSSPFELFLMFKDNTVFLGSSKADMMAIQRGAFVSKLSSKHKRNMKRNVTSMFANGKKIVSEIPVDSYPKELRNKIQFLTDNTEEVYLNFEDIKGNTMKGQLIWNTPEEGHKNSFAYFINMIDSLMD